MNVSVSQSAVAIHRQADRQVGRGGRGDRNVGVTERFVRKLFEGELLFGFSDFKLLRDRGRSAVIGIAFL